LSDGITTELLGGSLPVGSEVIVGSEHQESDEDSASPFLPKVKNDKVKR
jgi:HlyD family secretion protein